MHVSASYVHTCNMAQRDRLARLDATLACIHASIIGHAQCRMPAPASASHDTRGFQCSASLPIVDLGKLRTPLLRAVSRSKMQQAVAGRVWLVKFLALIMFPVAARRCRERYSVAVACSSRQQAPGRQGACCCMERALRAQPFSLGPGHPCETTFVLEAFS